jgi:glycosyltransferase involved in cell wall biosynthesis
MSVPQWIVTQLGAREHYAVPRAFVRRQHLALFFTEAWCRLPRKWTRGMGHSIAAFGGRYHAELPTEKVVSFTAATLFHETWSRLTRPDPTLEQRYAEFARQGEWFAKSVNRHLRHFPMDARQHCFFGFNTGALETLHLMRERGIFSVLDQLDPGRTDEEVVAEEARKWPEWEAFPGSVPEPFYQRIAQEWEAASLILVNSPWSKQALLREGVAESKIIVVPLAYEPEIKTRPTPKRVSPDRPLTVLWLGQIVLRKGIPYLFEAARQLQDRNIRFVVAGTIGISAKAVAGAPKNLTIVGRVTRSEALRLFSESDVFVLPTMSDGFAMTQLEAMSFGLPVVATRRCGEVVEDGVDGLIVPAGDSQTLAQAIAKLDEDRGLVEAMSVKALEKSAQFPIEAFAQRVEAALPPALRP